MVARAAIERGCEQPLETSQVGHLAPHRLQVFRGDLSDLIAAGIGWPAKFEDSAHFLRSEPEFAGTANEPQGTKMILIVDAVAAFGPRRRGDQANFFEVSDRLDIDACAAG